MRPHRNVAHVAHSAAVTRTPQAVLVHVDGHPEPGAVNNASRGWVPVLIFAGAAPYTIEGELPGQQGMSSSTGSRTSTTSGHPAERQRAAHRAEREAARAAVAADRVQRARQPVYLVGPREVMEEDLPPQTADPAATPRCPPRWRRRGRRDRGRAGGRPPPADHHRTWAATPQPRAGQPGRPARDPGARVGAQPRQLPGQPPAALRLPVDHQPPEPAAGPGRRGPVRGQRRAVDPYHQPALARRRHLLHRRRPAEVGDADVAHPGRKFAAANSRLALGQLTRYITASDLVDEAR